MKAAFLLFFYGGLFFTACSQQEAPADPVPVVTQRLLAVGESTVAVQQTRFSTAQPYFFVHLHSDEATALQAARVYSSKKGIPLLQIQNNGERLVSFRQEGKLLRFDPNRIFSEAGIRKTLALYNSASDAAFAAVQGFRDTLLQLLDTGKTIIALHNNTDNRFTILHYKETGIGQVHINPELDVDDFFLTNDVGLFERLQERNFNVVLEDATRTEEDGSLSLYCSRESIRYVNVEAEHGHLVQQTAMLDALLKILN